MTGSRQLTRGLTSRRDAFKLAGAGALVGVTGFPFVKRASAAGKKLAVGTWGGSYEKMQRAAYFEPFTKETGIDVEPVASGILNAVGIKAMIETGNYAWSCAPIGSAEYYTSVKNGWLEPIDYKLIDKSDKSDNQFKEFGITGEAVGSLYAYRKDRIAKAPSNQKEFFDVKNFPGRRSMWKNAKAVVENSLIADGVPLDKIYPYDLDRAFKKADELKSIITTWWTTGSQSQDVIVNGNVDICLMWTGPGVQLVQEGRPIAVNVGTHTYETGFFVVPKGAPDKEAAMRLINVAAGARSLAKTAEMIYYAPSNSKALGLLDKALLPMLTAQPGSTVATDGEYVASIKERLEERFLEWFVK